MKLLNKWLFLGIALLWAANASAQPANNNGGGPGAFDEQQQAKDLTGKRGQQQIDLFTGSFGYSIPIACAPARNGSEPNLALAYSSGGDLGWCGMGWKLDIGYIERNTRDGFPIAYSGATPPAPSTQYDDGKGFVLNLFGKELKLIAVGNNEYRPETDADFLRCFLDTGNNKWTVYDKGGNTYYFGQSSSSRVTNTKSGWSGYSATFNWSLDEVDTATGDQTTVAYTTYNDPDNSSLPEKTIYPSTVTYNGHPSASYTGQHTISFVTEIRPDRRVSFRWGFRAEQNRRLTNIVCQAGSQKVWSYSLRYGTSPATGRSLLTNVILYGFDAGNNATAFLTNTFAYQGNTNGVSFGTTQPWANMNLADPTSPGSTDPYLTQVSAAGSTLADLVDIDGDGLPDRVSYDGSGTQDTYQVQRNLGMQGGSGSFGARSSFGPTSSGTSSTASDSNPIPDGGYYSAVNSGYARILDLNGDGLPDRVADYWKHFSSIYYATTPYTNFAVMLNTGGGFGSAFYWPLATNDLGNDPNTYMSVIESGPSQPYVGLVDLNGDGLPDRVLALYNQPEINFKVQLNTGTNFAPVKLFGPYRSQNYTNSTFSIPWSGINTPYATLLDMNGDGLPDRVMLPMDPANPGYPLSGTNPNFNYFAVEYNDGYAFESTNTSAAVPGAYDRWPGVVLQSGAPPYNYTAINNLPVVGMYDLNGDGLPDRVMLDETAYASGIAQWLVYLNNGHGFNTNAIKVPVDNQGVTPKSREWDGLGWSDANAYGSTVATLMDINGDGLLDRVMKVYDNGNGIANTHSNFFLVQLNAGPFPDLLTNVANGIGGNIGVSYNPSTAYNNRVDPANTNSVAHMPFPRYVTAAMIESDGVNPPQTTTYKYAGGFFDGVRREFHGFAVVTNIDPTLRATVTYFHTGGGRNYSALGEYQDTNSTTGAGNFAKAGMAYRVETYCNDNALYHVTVNQVDQASLGNGRYFPFVTLSLDCDYPGGGSPKITATDFIYDTTTGNLTNKIEYGLVTGFDPNNAGSFPFNDADSTDTRSQSIHYTTIGTYILDHPDDATLTDTSHNVIQETKNIYNSPSGTLAARLTRIAAGYYATNGFGYNSYGLVALSTNPVGVVTETTYDSTYNTYPATTLVRVNPAADGSGDFITTTAFDLRSGFPASTTDPAGVRVTNSYDSFCRLVESDKIPVGGSAVWMKKIGYNLGPISSGNAVSYVDVTNNDGVGGVESRTYIDGFGRPIQTRAQGESGNFRVVSTGYDPRGVAFFTTWPQFQSGAGYVIPASGLTATWTGFDAAGRAATNRPVNVTFTSAGAFSSKTDLAGDSGSPLAAKTWSYVNGTDPWWVIFTDEDGQVRRYGLDAFGRTNQIQEVDGSSTYTNTLKYDLADNLTNIVNANGENIYWAFNDAGGMVAMADPYLGQWNYQRDLAGRVRVQTDGRSDVVKLYYTNSANGYQDPLGRVQRKEVYSLNYTNLVLTLVSTVTNLYDSNGGDSAYTVYPGLLFETIDSQGWEKNGYDARERTIKTTRYLNINGNSYTTTNGFDDGNNVIAIGYPNSGPTIAYSYFTGGSIHQVSRGSYNYYTVSAANYDEFGHVTSFAYNNSSLTTTRSYYTTSKRLQSISAGSVFSRTYTYTTNDDIASLNGTGISGTVNVTYYNLHRIKTYTGLSGSYGYDPVGNMTNNIEGGGSSYSYANPRKQAVRRAFGYTNLYDLCGNMIVRHGGMSNSQALVYDPENQLVRFSQAGTNFLLAKFGYAGDGMRLWKWSNQTTNYLQVWIGNIYEEKGGKILYHVFAGGQQICTFETNSPLYGGSDSSKVGYYYHEDNLNSSTALSSSSGSQAEVNVYYPFGRAVTGTLQASFKVSRQFTGQIKDDDTGLCYYNARYFDPELGRFIQPDTIIPDFSNPQSYNRYSYVVNDPLRYTDPTGHTWVLFDKEAWGQLLSPVKNFFVGGQYPVNHERAMLAQEGIQQFTPLTKNGDPNGEKLGNPATAVVAAGGGALLTAGTMMTPAGEEEATAGVVMKEGKKVVSSLEQRAKELHGLLNPQAQRMRTTAVTETEEGATFVSSSEKSLSKAQKAALKPGEVAAEGAGHAEATGVNAAKQAGMTPTATAASRPICPTCAQTLQEQGVKPVSPLKQSN